MKTFASIFSGGELAGIGAVQAGLTPIWGIECDPDIASVAEMNTSAKVIIDYAQRVDFSQLESPFWLHASPECKRASVANTGGEETDEDLTQAHSVERALFALKPEKFSLENVWNYRNFKSFLIICNALHKLGYNYKFWHLNSANYGVPQTRKRLILVASLTSVPQRPRAAHAQFPQEGLFESLPRWRGWYEAVKDIVDELPECDFAEWQYRRLPEQFAGSLLVGGGNSNINKVETKARLSQEPAFTVAGCNMLRNNRAFVAHPNADNDWFLIRFEDEPIFTIKANGSGQPRAFIIDGKPANYAGDLQVCAADEPVVTLTASQTRHPFRAWLEHGRVASMTPRALARFQSIPDSYALPEKNSLACRVIGNAVPPLLMQRIIEVNT